MPWCCCGQPELDVAFGALTPVYSKNGAVQGAPLAAIHRPNWGTLGTLVLAAGQYAVFYPRRTWRRRRNPTNFDIASADVYRPGMGEPLVRSFPIDKDPQKRPVVLSIYGRTFTITPRGEMSAFRQPEGGAASSVVVVAEPEFVEEPIPEGGTPEASAPPDPPAPKPAPPAPVAPVAAPAPVAPVAPPVPVVLEPPFCTHGGWAAVPPTNPAVSGPWARDLEITARRIENPALFRAQTAARGRTSVLN